MSLINAAALADVMKGVRTNFNLGLDDAKSAEDLDRWKMFAEEPKPRSKKKKEDLTWIKAVASLIPWIGTKEIIKLEAGGFEVEHRKFHRTIEIDEDDIADAAALLSLANIARKIGHAAMEWPNEMVLGLFNGIFTGEKCYTGKNFAATNHRIARKNFSNKLTTALSAADKASAKASVGAAILAMRKAWDDSGRIVRAKPTTLVVPPDLEETADLLWLQ